MDYLVRKAVADDEKKIRELFIEMLRSIYHTEHVQGYEEGYLHKFWRDREDRIYVAVDEAIVAFLSVEVYREPEEYIYLDDLSVTEQYRNKTIGSFLIHTAESYAKELGIDSIVFHVEKTNQSAFRLYERLGYTIYRDDGNRYLMRKDISKLNFRRGKTI